VKRSVVLFLCTGNSARSQMAEAFLRHYAGDHFEVHSAGLEPCGIHPLTTQVMNEVGISLADHRSKPLAEFLGRLSVRFVIIVCDQAEQQCPKLWPFALERLFWPFENPAAFEGTDLERLEKFREVRDQIQSRVERWLATPEVRSHLEKGALLNGI